jgi:exosortase/archaeosortase family protein
VAKTAKCHLDMVMTATDTTDTALAAPPEDTVAPGLRRSWRDWRAGWEDRWRNADPATRRRVQVGVFLGVIVVAYHYSLTTLVQSLNLDTPLAYVGLVPFIALGLAAVGSRQATAEPPIYDRQVDYIIGVPLLATAFAINLLLPVRMSAMFWVWRIDLLSLPFFVAGTAAIIFGIRTLWRQRLAIAFLFLAWPLPYTALLIRQLNAVTSITLRALRFVLPIVHVGSPSLGGDPSTFNIVHHGVSFPLSVVSACSGVNGMVGFLLVGAAFGATVNGPRLRKAIWLGGGLFLLWVMNLVRLLLIFWVGQQFGEHFAIKVLHPFVGLVTFNVGVVIMVLLLKRAGLQIGKGTGPLLSQPKAEATTGALPLAVPRLYSAFGVVAVLGLVLGAVNTNLSRYNLVARADGEPKLASFLNYPASPPGWAATFSTEYNFAKPFFGESSSWYRYTYGPTLGPSDLHSSAPVVADVVNTNDLSSFSAYGVEACYRFHGYSLQSVRQIDLGGGITGQTLSYTTNGGRQDWSIVYWIWPVQNGTSVRYERIILYGLNTSFVSVKQPGSSDAAPAQSTATGAVQESKAQRTFLVAFAREIVQAQTSVPIGAMLPRNTPEPSGAPFSVRRQAPFLARPAGATTTP